MIIFIWFVTILTFLSNMANLFSESRKDKFTQLAMFLQSCIIIWGIVLIVLNW